MKKCQEMVKHYKRHTFLMPIMRSIIRPFCRIRMAYQSKLEDVPPSPCIIISNHNGNLDPCLVMLGLKKNAYFVANEHAYRNGLPSKLLKFIFDPIIINKAQPDPSTMKEIFRRLRAGHNVCIFAEGNRSNNGLTGEITLATAKMVKISGASLATFRLEGGYFTTPRWSKNFRKGKSSGRVTGRYTAEELKSMTNDKILEIIKQNISEDAYKNQKEAPVSFRGKNLAEYIETVLYLCPSCKKIGTIHSKGNKFFCSCGLSVEFTQKGFFENSGKTALPFSTITEWDLWQSTQLEEIIASSGDETLFSDEDQILFSVEAQKKKSFAGRGRMYISRSEFFCAGKVFPVNEIKQFIITGMMTLGFAVKDGSQYEVESPFPRSALKYLETLNIINRVSKRIFEGL